MPRLQKSFRREIGAGCLNKQLFEIIEECDNRATENALKLISLGADPNAKNDQEIPALYYAAVIYENIFVAKILLEKGANVNERVDGDSALRTFASWGSNLEILDLLLKNSGIDKEEIKSVLKDTDIELENQVKKMLEERLR